MPYPFPDDSLRPFTAPLERALQLQSAVDDIRYKREAREMQRQQFIAEMEDRDRRRKAEDFQTSMFMRHLRAVLAEPGASEQSDAIVSKNFAGPANMRPLVRTPDGQTYRLPSQNEQAGYDAAAARRAGAVEGIKRRTEEDIANPYVDVSVPTGLPGPFSAGNVKVREKDRVKILEDAWKRAYPNMHITSSTNDAGDLAIFGTNPNTGETKQLRTVSGVGKSYHPPNSRKTQADYEAEVDATAAPNRDNRIEQMMPWAYGKLGVRPERANPTQRQAAYRIAAANVDNAIKEERRAQIAQRRLADRQGKQSPAPGAAAAPPSKKAPPSAPGRAPASTLTVKASDLPAKLSEWNRAHPGQQFDMNSLRKELIRRNYTIDEAQ